jgi:tight adherence protein C
MLDAGQILVLTLSGIVIVVSTSSLCLAAMKARYPTHIRKRLASLNRPALRRFESFDVRDSLLDRLGRFILTHSKLLESFEELTRSAGYFSQAAPYRLGALVALSGLALSLVGMASAWLLGLTLWRLALAGAFGLLVGGLTPLSHVLVRKRQRLTALRRELPFCVDILIVMLRSGNSIEQCFRQVLALGPMSFPETYRTVELLVADLDSGKSYVDTFDHWARLLAIPLAQTLANVFTQALLHGTEIAVSLEQLADILVEDRLQEARMAAGKRLPQLTVIMLIFLLPPMLVIIGMPAISQLMAGIGHMK